MRIYTFEEVLEKLDSRENGGGTNQTRSEIEQEPYNIYST